ncbi:prolactin regulatory element-binding protein [Spea bombifrons]|uniref:prolactin regulatory element-binding protein n=1 Tax=Spea bombifrons TaxID=233779 RepID=UPI00234999BC|nr:prolactin regulatory element-binding protein [Spea bombifrons]XP_053315099.1 prolactin regulatory element-binding protein [Spea bombifrons]XP_053315100.1 prolactin regulatory element-binding protein [Spea bombifrons]
MGRRRLPDLYRAPFPLYTIRTHPETGLVVTAGGGGASKTGIKNAMHFLRLERISGKLSASLLHSHDTDARATMTMALHGDTLAAGQDATCQILRFQIRPHGQKIGSREKDESGGARKRRPSKSGTEEASNLTKNQTPEISLQTLQVVQTDFSPDNLQKAVCFNQDGTKLLTGGVDGHLRVWEFPGMKKLLDFKAHEGEVEDIAASPGKKVVTVGQDFRCSVWEGDQLLTDLHWNENLPNIPDKMYRYRACRFGRVEDRKDALCLYTVQIPHKRERRPPPCYITKWDGQRFLPLLTQSCGKEVISCLTVSDCGTFLGLGTITGSVAIYISFSLQKLYYVEEAHGIVVTDLAFLPETPQGRALRGDNETALLSVAVDSRCLLHTVPNRRTFPLWLVVLLCLVMVVCVVLSLQYAFPGLL